MALDNDIIVANINDGTIQLLKNNGDGSFVVGSPQNVGINPEAIIAGDLNGDGAADLVVANRYNAPASGKLQILLNDGSGTLSVKAGQVAVDTGVEHRHGDAGRAFAVAEPRDVVEPADRQRAGAGPCGNAGTGHCADADRGSCDRDRRGL